MKPSATILCVFLFLLGSVTISLADELELLKDGKREKIYKVIVNPKVKPFLVHLIYKHSDEIDELVVRQLKIYTQGSKSPVQVLPANMLFSYDDEAFFLINDFNFDGYDDLMLLTTRGAHMRQYEIWLFDPETRHFVYNKDLSSLISPFIYENQKLIVSEENFGSMGLDYHLRYFRWKDKKLTLVREESEKVLPSEEPQKFHKIVKELRNGKLIKISDRILSEDEARTEWDNDLRKRHDLEHPEEKQK